MAPTRNYPMCENSTRYNRTRNFGLYGHAESKKTQKFVFRSALRPNQISFSHGQDPCRKSRRPVTFVKADGHCVYLLLDRSRELELERLAASPYIAVAMTDQLNRLRKAAADQLLSRHFIGDAFEIGFSLRTMNCGREPALGKFKVHYLSSHH